MAIPKSSIRKRGRIFLLDYSENGVRRRVSLRTASLAVARERQRRFDSARARGEENIFPTQTPLTAAVAAYVAHMRVSRTRHGYTADLSYLRSAFGPICEALTPRRRSSMPPEAESEPDLQSPSISATYLEQITVTQVSDFIRDRMRRNGIQAKTANRYREVLRRLFSWSMEEGGIRMPSGINPAARVKRYKEQAPEIQFLTLGQIKEQLALLQSHPVIHTMAATYIYAGLRREEAIWLTPDDVDLRAGGLGAIRIRAKTVEGEFWQPKTKVNRIVPISRALYRILERYVGLAKHEEWFFRSPKGKRWDPDNFSDALRKINREAGLPWSCLMFRHTFGSLLAMKGESLYKISTLLGNSPEICRRHYAALLPEALVESVEFGEGTD